MVDGRWLVTEKERRERERSLVEKKEGVSMTVDLHSFGTLSSRDGGLWWLENPQSCWSLQASDRVATELLLQSLVCF